jgi:hypothetical protein
MVMAEKSFPAMVGDDLKKLFGIKAEALADGGKPGSELPPFGREGTQPAQIRPEVKVVEAEQRDPVQLIAIPTEVKGVVNTRSLPAKRGSMETFYPGTTANTAVLIQGADPRIRRLIIQCATQACWFGSQEAVKALANSGVGTSSSGVFQMTATSACPPWEGIHEDLWGLAVNGGAVVSVRREYWTDI